MSPVHSGDCFLLPRLSSPGSTLADGSEDIPVGSLLEASMEIYPGKATDPHDRPGHESLTSTISSGGSAVHAPCQGKGLTLLGAPESTPDPCQHWRNPSRFCARLPEIRQNQKGGNNPETSLSNMGVASSGYIRPGLAGPSHRKSRARAATLSSERFCTQAEARPFPLEAFALNPT